MDRRPLVVAAGELTSNDVGQCLMLGRLIATIKSKKSGTHVTVQLTAKCSAPPKREGQKRSWEACSFPEAERVFIDVPRYGDEGARSGKPVGAWCLRGWEAGHIVTPYGQDEFDPGRLWAAIKAVEIAADRAPIETDAYALQLSSRCMLCGRELTQPDSIERGIGPECLRQISGFIPPDTSRHEAPVPVQTSARPSGVQAAAEEALERRAQGDPAGSPSGPPPDVQMTLLSPGQAAQSALTADVDPIRGAGTGGRRGPGRDAYLERLNDESEEEGADDGDAG